MNDPILTERNGNILQITLNRLTRTSLHSFAWSKRLIADSLHTTLETQLELERQGISDCDAHPDGPEGLKAFVEKRKPSF